MKHRCFKPERNRLHRQRGVASVLAMLYLVLFSVLAVCL